MVLLGGKECIGQLNQQKRKMRGTEDLANIQSDTFLTYGKRTLLWSSIYQQYVENGVHILQIQYLFQV